MNELELIVAALAAGAVAGAGDAASSAARDSYLSLRDRLRRKIQGAKGLRIDEEVIDVPRVAAADERGNGPLVDALLAIDAAGDPVVINLARHILELTGSNTPTRFKVKVDGSTGVQVGNHNSMNLHL
jgi:RIP homotypic interaction motif